MTSDVAQSLAVTVLICSFNRPRELDRALAQLANGTELPDQVVIVNGGSDDANAVVTRYADTFPDAILIQYGNQNLAVSRNLGLSYCEGDVIAMTDDDAEVAPTWLAGLREAHRLEPTAGAIGGPVDGTHDDKFLSRVADRVVFPTFPDRREVRTLPGVSVSYKRAAVDRVGNFDIRLFRGEDVDFNWRLIRLGYSIVYEPDIRVRHAHRSTLKSLLEQQYMYGRAYVLVREKWPDLYCVYPQHLRSFRDWAKLIHAIVAVGYQPALAARRMPTTVDAVAAYPILLAHHLVWKVGMLREKLARRGQLLGPQGDVDLPPVTLYRRWKSGREVTSHASAGAPN